MVLQKETEKTNGLEKLNKFLRQNKAIDWLKADLVNETKRMGLNWKGLEDDQEALKYVKAYQRLVKVLGEDDPKLIKALLKLKLHSAIQIAAIPKKLFIKEYSKAFGSDTAKMEKVHQNAVSIRSGLLIKYMDHLQNNEPHAAKIATL